MTLLAGLLLVSMAQAPSGVLIVVLDDVAERDVERISTPALDALAAEGLRFRRAYASPLCSASRRELLFGIEYTAVSGDPCLPANYVPEIEPTPGSLSLARLFQDAGRATALFGKWHLGAGPTAWELAPTHHGFDVWRAGVFANVNAALCPVPAPGTYVDWLRADDGTSKRATKYQTSAVRDSFVAWHASLPQGATWFAICSFQASHGPWTLPPGVPSQGLTNRQRYEIVLTEADTALGVMLGALDLETTMVLVLGDNGTPANAVHPVQEATKVKGTTFEDGIRVPLVAAGPGIPVGAETQALVSITDLLPTFAELLETDFQVAPGDLAGVSLLSIFHDPGAAGRPHVYQGNTRPPAEDHAVVTAHWKYRRDLGVPHLYDLENDPGELQNLAGNPGLAALEAELEALLDTHL
jgi:arylsulfatase A-like enzyme